MTNRSNPVDKIDPKTPLKDLGLPYIDVILTERFLLPPEALRKIGEPVPNTFEELVAMSGMPVEEVWTVICECLELDRDLRDPLVDLDIETKKDGVILLDMRPGVTFDSEPLHPNARLFHAQNPQTLLSFLRTLKTVYVLSHSDEHAWSAAVSLKKMGIAAKIPTKLT